MKFKQSSNGEEPKRSKKIPQQGVRIDIRVPDVKDDKKAIKDTITNIHALTVLQLKIFGRLGFLVKKIEELTEVVEKG